MGVIFDNKINMQFHIKNVSRAAMYHLYNISKIKRYLGQSATEQIIHALVTSRMDYCNSVLVGQSTSALAPLQRVQNAAARLLTNGRKFDHITPALMQLHWLPVKHRVIYKVCLLIFKCLHESAPSYLSDLLDVRIPGRFTRSALDSSIGFSVPKLGCLLLVRGCFLWLVPVCGTSLEFVLESVEM